ncbi:MAG: hypothetical protein WEE51_11950, partial [Pirellulaceae bacterium]
MKPPNEKQAVSLIAELLADLFGSSPMVVHVDHVGNTAQYDYSISVADRRFIAEYKSNSSAGSVDAAIKGLQRFAESHPDAGLPLVVVPFMGEVGRQICEQSQVSWLDLCGNAKIVAPGLRIWVELRPNKFTDRGRPPNVFAPKSSRIARQCLLDPERFQAQVELARRTGLDDGYVSKIVRRLKQENYLDANEEGAVRPRDPNLLLDAWRDSYDFSHHQIIKGHVPARSGEHLLQQIASALSQENLEWGATGLGAAWLYSGFATFRIATVYLSSMPPQSLLKEMAFSEELQGANLWLVLPDDDGVFHGGQV